MSFVIFLVLLLYHFTSLMFNYIPMNKLFTAACIALMATAVASCKHADTHALGQEAGKAQCECYSNSDSASRVDCINGIAEKYAEYKNDSLYLEAVEAAMLKCTAAMAKDEPKPIVTNSEPTPSSDSL